MLDGKSEAHRMDRQKKIGSKLSVPQRSPKSGQ